MAEMISPFSDDTMLTFRSVSVGGGLFKNLLEMLGLLSLLLCFCCKEMPLLVCD